MDVVKGMIIKNKKNYIYQTKLSRPGRKRVIEYDEKKWN